MFVALLILHLLICLALIGVVLIQSGKGGGLAGGAFGGSAQTVFGGRGATDFITRATMVLGGLFFVTSLVLAMMSSGLGNRPTSILQRESRNAAPAAPGQAPPRSPGSSPTAPPAGTTPAPPAQPPGTAPPSSGGP